MTRNVKKVTIDELCQNKYQRSIHFAKKSQIKAKKMVPIFDVEKYFGIKISIPDDHSPASDIGRTRSKQRVSCLRGVHTHFPSSQTLTYAHISTYLFGCMLVGFSTKRISPACNVAAVQVTRRSRNFTWWSYTCSRRSCGPGS